MIVINPHFFGQKILVDSSGPTVSEYDQGEIERFTAFGQFVDRFLEAVLTHVFLEESADQQVRRNQRCDDCQVVERELSGVGLQNLLREILSPVRIGSI